jgi:phage terminase small subunit
MPASGEVRDRNAANGRRMTSERAKQLGFKPPVRTGQQDTGLTPRQQKFVIEYSRDMNPAAAARRAGYGGKNLANAARTLMHTPKVAAAIQTRMNEVVKKADIDAVGVLTHAVEMLRADVHDIMDANGTYRPISEWPLIWRQMLSSCEVRSMCNVKGEEVGSVTNVKFADRLKVLELIGRHIDVRAFVTQHEVSGPNGGPVTVVDVTRLSTDRLEQMRHWLMEAAQSKALPAHPDIDVRSS